MEIEIIRELVDLASDLFLIVLNIVRSILIVVISQLEMTQIAYLMKN